MPPGELGAVFTRLKPDRQTVVKLIPDARLEILPAGHVPQLGHSQRVAELLTEFAHQQAE